MYYNASDEGERGWVVILENGRRGSAGPGRSGGVEEAVLNGQTGLVVDIYQGDKIVADSIIELLRNEEYSRTFRHDARVRLEADFKWVNQLKVIGDGCNEFPLLRRGRGRKSLSLVPRGHLIVTRHFGAWNISTNTQSPIGTAEPS